MLINFKFHHIGYAVKSIKKSSLFYIESGYSITEAIFDPIQIVNIAFLSKTNFPLIEFVEAVSEDSPVNKILEKNGVAPYHVCYEVDDIEAEIANLRKNKFIPLFKPVEAIALNNRKICYLYHNDFGLIELLNEN